MQTKGISTTLALALFMTGCALQRAQVANDAKTQLVGKTKEEIVMCMGVPSGKTAEGALDIWTYNAGNGYTEGSSTGFANVNGYGNNANIFGTTSGSSEGRFCIVTLLFGNGRVARVTYTGPSGGIFTGDEQCSYVVKNCVTPQ